MFNVSYGCGACCKETQTAPGRTIHALIRHRTWMTGGTIEREFHRRRSEGANLQALIPAADTGLDEWVRLHVAIDALQSGFITSFDYPLVGGGTVTFRRATSQDLEVTEG